MGIIYLCTAIGFAVGVLVGSILVGGLTFCILAKRDAKDDLID